MTYARIAGRLGFMLPALALSIVFFAPEAAYAVEATPPVTGEVNLEKIAPFLVTVGLLLMIIEAISPTFGVAGLIGLATFVTGTALVVNADYAASWPLDANLLWGIALFGAVFIALTAYVTARVYRRHITTGAESLIGAQATVLEWHGQAGRVHIQGETWQAASDHMLVLSPGSLVTVSALENLTLRVHADA